MDKKVITLAMPRKEITSSFVKLFLLTLFLLCAMMTAQAAAQESNIAETDAEVDPELDSAFARFKRLIGLVELPEDTLAVIDGTPITLTDVEELANLNYITRNDESTLTIDYVLEEYSQYLFELIEQQIVIREIEKENITVPYSDVEQVENILRESYDGEFENQLESEGIDIVLWREQLRRRLEKEALQLTIISQIRISPQEIMDYREENAALFEVPAKYRVLMVSSRSQAELQAAHKAKINSIEDAKEFNVEVQEGLFTKTHLPEEWEEDIPQLERNKKTKINHSGNSYKYLILLEDVPAYTMSESDVFMQIEQQLREEKADRAYTQWLASALKETDIEIIPEFASILRADSENSASGLDATGN